MARYIDADILKRDLIDSRSFYPAIVKNAIEEVPTEDVVPRAEVEEILKEIELALDNNYKARNANGYGEFLSYINGKIDALRGIEAFVKEIEKKYSWQFLSNYAYVREVLLYNVTYV